MKAITIFLYENTISSSHKLKNIICVLLLLFALQLPSVELILKYLHPNIWFLSCYMFSISVFYYYLFLGPYQPFNIQKILNSHLTTLVLFIFILLINFVLYHYELALQAMGRGSDAGPALIMSGRALLHGYFPYLHLDYLHNPPSPGPGWVVLTMPFTCTGLYELLTPNLVISSALIIKKITRSNLSANLYLICLCSSPAFIQAMVTGIDYLPMGFMLCFLTIAIFYYWGEKKLYDIYLIIGTGMLATARLNFLYLAPLLGLFICGRDKKSGIYFSLMGLSVTLLFHIGFYLWNPQHYTPLHVIHDYGFPVIQNNDCVYTLVLICIITVIMTYVTLKNTLRSWLFLLWFYLTTPLFLADCLEVIHIHFQHFGFGFLVITMPILTWWICMNFNPNHQPPIQPHQI